MSIKSILSVAFSLPMMLFLTSPLSVFLGNRDQFEANFFELLGVMAMITVTMFLVIAGLLYPFRNWIVGKVLSGIVVGFAACVLIQSQFFAWNFGPLDGGEIAWDKWNNHAILELCVWLIVSLAAIIIAVRVSDKLRVFANFVIILGVLSVGSSYFSSHNKTGSRETKGIQTVDVFNFHPENNTVLIVLDDTQSDALIEIQSKWPEELNAFTGFTYYPDTIGGFRTTKASIPLIMTGQQYANEEPFVKWRETKLAGPTIPHYFDDKGFNIVLFSFGPYLLMELKAPHVDTRYLNNIGFDRIRKSVLSVVNYSIFRTVPIKAKPVVYDLGNWPLTRSFSNDKKYPSGQRGNDLRLVRTFTKHAKVRSNHPGEFKYFHLWGSHVPIEVDENFKLVDASTPKLKKHRDRYIRQVRGVFKLVSEMLAKMKELGIYDSAQILIVSDHGTRHDFLPIDLQNFDKTDTEIPSHVFSSARPLFLYKPSGSDGAIEVSNAQVHLRDVPCFVTDQNEQFDCPEYESFSEENPRSRLFFDHHLKLGWAKGRYLPPLKFYTVKGDSRDAKSWGKANNARDGKP